MTGVRLKSPANAGHFIALLERRGEFVLVAEPLEGLSTNTLAELQGSYVFTGFFLVVRKPDANR